MTSRQLILSLLLTASLAGLSPAGAVDLPEGWSWTYYRPTNTGIQGDYSDALWIDGKGDPYIAAYNPIWNEGGVARFDQTNERWENLSNVDYPVIGDPDLTNSYRVLEFIPEPDGRLWMFTGGGLLSYRPDQGPSSLVRYDSYNSPLPFATMRDVDRAPDGSLWICCEGAGLVRFEPKTETWTIWNGAAGDDGWPGWQLINRVNVQPQPEGGYLVWVQDYFYGRVVFDSATQNFSPVPNNDQPGEIAQLIRNGADEAGNVWMLREKEGSMGWSLDYRQPDGTWVVPPQPYADFYGMGAFKAYRSGQALMSGAGASIWHFDGASWFPLGDWPAGTSAVGGLGMDAQGNVWVSGTGGAARRDAATGQWQRYRVTNTSQIDMWVRDISFGAGGEVWTTGNASPGVGGIASFDGKRWYNFNIYHYGLGGDWPFPTDNADAIVYRPSTGNIALNPMNNGIHEWDGSNFTTVESSILVDGLTEDSLGRLWVIGNYFSLSYHDGNEFIDVPIAGWGWNIVTDPSRPGTVWACANLEVVRTDGEYRYSRENVDLPELNPVHDVLTTVAVGPDGIGWLGSTEGLFRLDPETGTHQWWHSSNSSLPGDQVQPLVVTPDGRVWFTNFNSLGIEASLVWFDGVEFGTVTRAQGLPHAQIYDAETRTVEGAYELWLSCASRGIAVLTVPLDPASAAPETAPVARGRLGCYPNPFNPRTELSFSLPAAGEVTLEIFDPRGRLVRRLLAGAPMDAGSHQVSWNGRDDRERVLPAGIYLARLQGAGVTSTAKLTLAK